MQRLNLQLAVRLDSQPITNLTIVDCSLLPAVEPEFRFLFNHARSVAAQGGGVLYFRRQPVSSASFLSPNFEDGRNSTTLRRISFHYSTSAATLTSKLGQFCSTLHKLPCPSLVVVEVPYISLGFDQLGDATLLPSLLAAVADVSNWIEQRRRRRMNDFIPFLVSTRCDLADVASLFGVRIGVLSPAADGREDDPFCFRCQNRCWPVSATGDAR